MPVDNGGLPKVTSRRCFSSEALLDGISFVARAYRTVSQDVAPRWQFNRTKPEKSGWATPVWRLSTDCCATWCRVCVFVVTVWRCRPLQTFKATRNGIGKVDRMLPTASMAGMRWLLGAHCDERGLSWFHTARSGLYHPNAMPRAEHRHALNGVDIVGCDPGGLHPLVTHEGLTIASRLIGRVRPTTAPAPALVESATTMLACALGTSVDRCVAVPLDTVPRLTLVCSCVCLLAR